MKKISTYCLAILALLLVSCNNEVSIGPDTGENGTIVFTLYHSSGSSGQTKATRSADDPLPNEKQINRIDVFFFDTSGSDCLFYPDNSLLAINTDKVTIKVPEDVMGRLSGVTDCKVYMIANCQLDRGQLEGKTLAQVKELVMENVDGKRFNEALAPVDFFMDSEEIKASFDGSNSSYNLGAVTLKRAAAKVIVDITGANIPDYTPSNASVRFVNYLDKTSLSRDNQYVPVSGEYKTANKTLIAQGDGVNSYLMDKDNPIYTYANNWANDAKRESYILIAMDWTRNDDSSTRTYYYRVPISYLKAIGNVEAHKNKISRNYIYQFGVNITRLGGPDPDKAVNLAANFDLVDWNDHTVEASILEYHYLFVYNPHVSIFNRSSNEWSYKSSTEPITITIDDVYCHQYDPEGNINRITYKPGDPQYPVYTTKQEEGANYITFSSKVPINYVPLYIKATVSNSASLQTDISLTIYPKIYVTASYSYGGLAPNAGADYFDKAIIPSGSSYATLDGRKIWLAGSYTTPDGTKVDVNTNQPNGDLSSDPKQINFNFFTVHVTSLDVNDEDDGMRIGDATIGITHRGSTQNGVSGTESFTLSDPNNIWKNGVSPFYYQTLTDEDHNNIVSPQFVIATQRGITSSDKSWEVAQQRCATYRESEFEAGSWRMPTLAELKLVRRMQLDPNSAIKELFQSGRSSGWWSARQGWSVILGESDDDIAISGSASINSVRCVHDIWRD